MVPKRHSLTRFLPVVIAAVFVSYVATTMLPTGTFAGGFDFSAFGRVPVLLNGRVRPMDSVARLGLLQIAGSVGVPSEGANGWRFWRRTRRIGPGEWLAELMMKPDAADARRIFPISEPQLLATLRLQAHAPQTNYFSFSDLHTGVETLRAETTRIDQLQPEQRAP